MGVRQSFARKFSADLKCGWAASRPQHLVQGKRQPDGISENGLLKTNDLTFTQNFDAHPRAFNGASTARQGYRIKRESPD
jgi:hypothetical protein